MSKPKRPKIEPNGYTFQPPTGDGPWLVTSPEAVTYEVYPDEGECSCADIRTKENCKHVKAIWGLLRAMPTLPEILSLLK